jgi:SnoaL-like domain
MSTPIVAAIANGDAAALHDLLAEDVTFNSPVRSYTGRDEVVHLLTTIGGLQEELRTTRCVDAPGETVSFIETRGLDGVLDERYDGDGRVTELTLMLRPLSELLDAVKRMGAALAR